MTIKIIENLLRDATILTPSSEHPQMPARRTQLDSKQFFWRSRYGIGSGSGLFMIHDLNKFIDFNEPGTGDRVATLAVGNYNGHTLAAEIASKMTAASGAGWTYSCVYNDTTKKFTISETSGPNVFNLEWQSGSHAPGFGDTSIGATIGFNESADDTGASSYTADYVRIHTGEGTDILKGYAHVAYDLGSAKEIDFIAIMNHNISATATIKFIGSTASTFDADMVYKTIPHNASNIFNYLEFGSIAKRYVKFTIKDPDNADGYIQIATPFAGLSWSPNRDYVKPYDEGRDDLSTFELSDSLVLFGDEKPIIDAWSLPFKGVNAATKDKFNSLIENHKKLKAFIVNFDNLNPNTTSHLVRLEDIARPVYQHYNKWDWEMPIKEVL